MPTPLQPTNVHPAPVAGTGIGPTTFSTLKAAAAQNFTTTLAALTFLGFILQPAFNINDNNSLPDYFPSETSFAAHHDSTAAPTGSTTANFLKLLNLLLKPAAADLTTATFKHIAVNWHTLLDPWFLSAIFPDLNPASLSGSNVARFFLFIILLCLGDHLDGTSLQSTRPFAIQAVSTSHQNVVPAAAAYFKTAGAELTQPLPPANAGNGNNNDDDDNNSDDNHNDDGQDGDLVQGLRAEIVALKAEMAGNPQQQSAAARSQLATEKWQAATTNPPQQPPPATYNHSFVPPPKRRKNISDAADAAADQALALTALGYTPAPAMASLFSAAATTIGDAPTVSQLSASIQKFLTAVCTVPALPRATSRNPNPYVSPSVLIALTLKQHVQQLNEDYPHDNVPQQNAKIISALILYCHHHNDPVVAALGQAGVQAREFLASVASGEKEAKVMASVLNNDPSVDQTDLYKMLAAQLSPAPGRQQNLPRQQQQQRQQRPQQQRQQQPTTANLAMTQARNLVKNKFKQFGYETQKTTIAICNGKCAGCAKPHPAVCRGCPAPLHASFATALGKMTNVGNIVTM